MSLRRELARKAFHCLSLVYLAAYRILGPSAVLWVVGLWTAAEGLFERARLRDPALNARLIRFFGGIHREKEENRMSGVWWTSLGCWFTFLLFGDRPRIVCAAVLYLTFGDMAAALVGKAWGRRVFEVAGRRKTLEGSAACFAACLACGAAAGLPPAAALLGAAAACAAELAPLPFDDNVWTPLLSAAALRLILPRG